MIKLVPYRANEYDLYEVKVDAFSAGETKFELPDDKRAHYRGIYWYYENDSEMFVIMCLVNEMPALKKYLYMPYFPARSHGQNQERERCIHFEVVL